MAQQQPPALSAPPPAVPPTPPAVPPTAPGAPQTPPEAAAGRQRERPGPPRDALGPDFFIKMLETGTLDFDTFLAPKTLLKDLEIRAISNS